MAIRRKDDPQISDMAMNSDQSIELNGAASAEGRSETDCTVAFWQQWESPDGDYPLNRCNGKICFIGDLPHSPMAPYLFSGLSNRRVGGLRHEWNVQNRAGDKGSPMDIRLTGHGVEQFATSRLVGRRLLPADTDFLTELHETEKVMSFHGGTRSRATTEPFVQSNVAHWRHYQFGLYMISLAEEPDEPIGRAGIRWDQAIGDRQVVDVSVVLTAETWGQGIATETVKAITAIGLDLDLPLAAGSEARHAAARRVLEKVGFIYDTDYERHGRGWVRYGWPTAKVSPGQLMRSTARR